MDGLPHVIMFSLAEMDAAAPARGGIRRSLAGDGFDLILARFEFNVGKEPSVWSVRRLVRHHLGYTYKKLSKIPPGQLSAASMQRRKDVIAILDVYPPDKVFWEDESGFGHQTSTGSKYGYARQGQRAVQIHKAGFRKNTTLIAVMGLCGVVAIELHVGGTKADRFLAFWRAAVPKLPKGALVVLDNASIHHKHEDDMREILEKGCGGQLLFLPPYSPDLSPIEPLFGWLKKSLMSESSDRLKNHLCDLIEQRLRSVPLSHIANWWNKKCGHPLPK